MVAALIYVRGSNLLSRLRQASHFLRSLASPVLPSPRSNVPDAPTPLRSLAPLLPFCLFPFLPLLLSTGGELELPGQSGALSRWSYLVTQSRVLVTYLRLLLLPIGQNLDYDYPTYDSLGEPVVLGSLLLLASLTALAVWAFRRHRVLAFAILWFFVTLSVTSSVIPILDTIFEHRLYLATLSYGLFLSYAVLKIEERWGEWGRGAVGRRSGGAGENVGAATVRERKSRRMALAVLFLLVAAYAMAAHQRNRVWGDDVGLWQDCVAKSPRKARPHNNLGSVLIEAGRYPEAAFHLEIAATLKFDSPEIYCNLGIAYQRLRLLDPAIEAFRRAIILRPRMADAHNSLAALYAKKGWYEKAVEEYEKSVRIEGDNASFRRSLESAYGELMADFRKRLIQDPDDLDLHHRLAAFLLKRGDLSGAIQHYEEILRLDPADLSARNNLGFAYGDLGDWDRAIAEQEQVLRRDPNFLNGYYGLAMAYEKKGMSKEAAAAWGEFLRRSPPNNPWVPRAWKHLQELRAGRQR